MALHRRRQSELRAASTQERIADVITRFAGRTAFVYIHAASFGFWIVANLRWLPGVATWDPSFVILAVFASIEAIFLSTFVLIAQNRMATAADKRADLDLQISLLAEHEITKLTALVSNIAENLGVSTHLEQEIAEIQQDVAPEAILEEIEKRSSWPGSDATHAFATGRIVRSGHATTPYRSPPAGRSNHNRSMPRVVIGARQ